MNNSAKAIKEMLMDLACVLRNGINDMQAEYKVSVRDVPYVSICFHNMIWNIVYFMHGDFFRIFREGIKYIDLEKRNDTIDFFASLKNGREYMQRERNFKRKRKRDRHHNTSQIYGGKNERAETKKESLVSL